MYFADEAGVRSDHHARTTWGAIGSTPVVKSTGAKFSVNMISALTAQGLLRFSTFNRSMTAEKFIEFCKRLINDTEGPVFLIVDGYPTHRAKKVTRFVGSTDLPTAPEAIVARYAERWSIETAIATGKQALGVGQARNRVARVVERTVPFGFIVQSLVILWYTACGHHAENFASRRAAEPAFEDMLAKLRRTIVAARFTPTACQQPAPDIIRDYTLACAVAAA